MKNIIIATDFSPAANNAALYAVELAKQYHATVHLFHAFQYPKDTTLLSNPIDLVKESKEWLLAQAELINEEGKVKLHMWAEEGPTAETILHHAVKHEADVIVCAMKGKSKAITKIFGSTTLSLITKSSVPLIVVPETVTFQKPSHIALAIDMDPHTSPLTLQLLKDVGEHFFSKVSVVYALNENFKENEVTKFHPPHNISEINHLHPTFEFRVGDDIARTVENFTNETAINMMAVIPHKHSRLERWFTESVTKSLVLKSHIPVMVLPQKISGVDDVKMNNVKLEKILAAIKEEH